MASISATPHQTIKLKSEGLTVSETLLDNRAEDIDGTRVSGYDEMQFLNADAELMYSFMATLLDR